MAKSVDEIVAKFPHKTLQHIDGEPDYNDINEMMTKLFGNASTLASPLGGGLHGHIGLIMRPALYATISDTPYAAPADPGALPDIPANATTPQREIIRANHKEQQRLHENNGNMDDAIKSMIVEAVDETYLSELHNKFTAFLGVTTRDMLDHLLDRHGKISAADLDATKKLFDSAIDSTQPIAVYFKKIDDALSFAADANTPWTPAQVLQTAYHAVSSTGSYIEPCKRWRGRNAADRTWPAFKTFFADEYHDLREQQRINTTQAGFHNANSAVQTDGIETALDNLAMATTSDQGVVAQMAAANTILTATNKTLADQLKVAIASNATLTNKLGQSAPTGKTAEQKAQEKINREKALRKREANLNPEGYCWTHGLRVVHGHTSLNCQGKRDGHKDAATRNDMQGGSTANNAFTG
jgi:hypothetical protein